MYRDQYRHRSHYYNHHHNVGIGSKNHVRLSIGAIACSPAATIATCFFLGLVLAAIIYLWITALLVLQILLAFGIGVLVWQGSMWCLRTFSNTRAQLSYDKDQYRRNRILSDPRSPVAVVEDKFGHLHFEKGGPAQYQYRYDARQTDTVVDADVQEVPLDPFETMLNDEDGY